MGLNMNNAMCTLPTILLIIYFITSGEVYTTTVNTESTIEETETTSEIILSTNLVTATCTLNSSCNFNSTSQDLVTSPSPTEHPVYESSTSSSMVSPSSISKTDKKQASSRSGKNLCICDLMVDYCDVNCCCDVDCSLENKLVFGHCESDFHHYDTRTCQYTKHVYINNTAHEFQINQDGLFCIVKSNLPPSYLIQRKHPLKSLDEAEFEKKFKYTWGTNELETVTKFSMANYTYGKKLWIVRNDRVENFQLPRSFIVANCLIKEDVKYLVDIRNSCSQTDIFGENKDLKAETYFKNFLIIANPNLLNITLYRRNIAQGCPKNICISVSPKICKPHFENCTPINRNTTSIQQSCQTSLLSRRIFCTNLVQHVRYNLYHNGTYGITKVDLFIILVNESYSFGKDVNFIQTLEVNFIWWNNTLNFSSYLSGNPGYLFGKPILTANIVAVNITSNSSANSTGSNVTRSNTDFRLFRNPSDFTKNFMVLPFVNTDGRCVLNKHEYTPIEFGFNMYLKCTVDENLLHRNITAKKLCVSIQETIFKYWSLNNGTNFTLTNLLIGQFGSANIYNIDDWLKVLFKDDINNVLNRTWGEFDSKTNILYCKNITTLLVVDIYHARVDFEDVINQEKILAVAVQFKDFKNLSFPFNLKETSFNIKVKIGSQIAFFDITTKKVVRIVDPPSLNIRLPHDFFYPFVKIDNKASKQTMKTSILFRFIFVLGTYLIC